MSEKAAITGTFSELKPIKTRGCVQVIVECPIEYADRVLKALGGYPQPGSEKTVAVALLSQDPETRKRIQDAPPALDAKDYTKIAAIRCQDRRYQVFLEETYPDQWRDAASKFTVPDAIAADVTRHLCRVTSRRHINDSPDAQTAWMEIERDFSLWKHM